MRSFRLAARAGAGRTAIFAATLLLALLAGSLALDRDQNGADDGGLDLCFVSTSEILLPGFVGMILVAWMFPHMPLVPAGCSSPRSPPPSRSLV